MCSRRLGEIPLSEAKRQEVLFRSNLKEKETSNEIMFWRDVCSPYIQRLEIESRSESVIYEARKTLKSISEFFSGKKDIPIKEISPRLVEDYRLERLKTVSKVTVNKDIAIAHAAFNYILPDEKNPFRVKRYRVDNLVTNLLSKEEERNLFEALKKLKNPHYGEMIFVAFQTGLRKHNITHLRRDEVDFQYKTLQIIQKGDRRLTIPVNSSVVELLQSIPENGTPFFWINKYTKKPYRTIHYDIWAKVKELAGIKHPFRIHDIRHVAATKILAVSHSLKVAQEFLGHTTIKHTQRYAHLTEQQLREAIEKLR